MRTAKIAEARNSPGSAINESTRAHFANAIQRLRDERRYRDFIALDPDATRFPTAVWRPNGFREQRKVTVRPHPQRWSVTEQALAALEFQVDRIESSSSCRTTMAGMAAATPSSAPSRSKETLSTTRAPN
jgi:hypothetical protein